MEEKITAEFAKILQIARDGRASDIHLFAGKEPWVRVNDVLSPVTVLSALSQEKILAWFEVLAGGRIEEVKAKQEVDFSFSWEGLRFRVNLYWQKGRLAAALRLIPGEIPPVASLGLPEILTKFCGFRQGLILITGPTGSGKSTTTAALLDFINKNQAKHIVTIEDPIEYILKGEKSIISQREFLADTQDWVRALRAVLRQDPDVVFVGEMRDLVTIQAVLTIAETGHLVFSTLHTNSAAQSVDRIVDVFPKEARGQIAVQLANSLRAVISQRLVPNTSRGRSPAVEILMATNAAKTAIREGKTHMIDNIIQTSAEVGMVGLDRSLAGLVRKGVVKEEAAENFSLKAEEFRRQLKSVV